MSGKKFIAFLYNWRWMFLGIIGLFIHFLFTLSPGLTEQLYSRGLFRVVRWVFSHTFAYAPFPIFYVLLIFLLIQLYHFISFLGASYHSLKEKLDYAVHALLSFAGAAVFSFYFLWGYNYSRIPFDQQIGLQMKEVDSVSLRKELENAAADVVAAKIAADAYGSPPAAFFNDLGEFMRDYTSRTLNRYGFPAGGNLRGRMLKPDGILYRFGSSGVYLPWIGESNIDAAIHPLQKPFILAHELSHGYGWGDEGTCNFIAYLTCTQSSSPYVRYSGFLDYYRYVASNYRVGRQKEYARFRASLPPGVRSDLEEINQTISRYPEWITFNFVYEWYLKGNGIPEGMQNYNKVISLVYSYRIAQSLK